MRYFVITGHKAATDGSFKLDDLAGGAGRMDILVRCVNSAFVMSHNLRKDAEIYLVLEGGEDAPKTVRFQGSTVKYLNPDERSTASLSDPPPSPRRSRTSPSTASALKVARYSATSFAQLR